MNAKRQQVPLTSVPKAHHFKRWRFALWMMHSLTLRVLTGGCLFGFDDAGNLKHSIGAFGRVLQGFVARKSGAHFVFAEHITNRQRVHCRLDALGVEARQGLEVAQNLAEFVLRALALERRIKSSSPNLQKPANFFAGFRVQPPVWVCFFQFHTCNKARNASSPAAF